MKIILFFKFKVSLDFYVRNDERMNEMNENERNDE